MKRIISTQFLVFCFAALFAGKGIVVTQKYTGPDAKNGVSITWYATDQQCKMKMDYKDDKVSSTNWFIPDLGKGALLSYTEGAVPAGATKMYYTIPVGSIQGKGAAENANLKVEHTGETKTLSGLVCEKLVITGNGNTTEMWVTKSFTANVYRYSSFFKTITELAALKQDKIAGFPLASVTKDENGAIVSSFELVSASTTEMSATDFEVPAEYKSASK